MQSAAKENASSVKMVSTLGGIAMISGILIVLVVQATAEGIRANKKEALESAVFQVLPGATARTTFVVKDNGFEPLQGEAPMGAKLVYAGYDDQGKLVGIAIEGDEQGYQDIIRAIFGYSPEQQAIIGFNVLESKETPGLGDRIAKDPDFLRNFEALDVTLNADGSAFQHPLAYAKHGEKANPWEIDGITGATISSKAVTRLLDEDGQAVIPMIQAHVQDFMRGGK